MAEYIEREAFIEDIKTEITNLRMNGLKGTPRPHGELYDFIDRINEQPTVDVAPIRHGRWIIDGVYIVCSVCNRLTLSPIVKQLPTFKYCPNCGAKLGGLKWLSI